MHRSFFLIISLVVIVFSFSLAHADETIGGACSGTVAAGPQAANGNNVACVSSVWQYPAYQFGSTAASCNSANAGIIQWTGAVFQGCNGVSWGSVDTIELNLGSITTTNPFISGSVTNGLYTAAAAKVDVGISGTKRAEWTSTGETVNGTETANSYIPTGSAIPANGMYLSAANTVDFSTSSGKRLQISSAGVLDLGSLSAAATLQLGGVTILANPAADGTSLAISTSAFGNLGATTHNSTAAGFLAGEFATGGQNNTAIGQSALLGDTNNPLSGSNNTAVGDSALKALINALASNNTVAGQDAGAAITTGLNNTIYGTNAGSALPSALTTGSGNIVVGQGDSVAAASTTSTLVVGIAVKAGSQDTAIGWNSFICTVNNCDNVGIGDEVFQNATAAGANNVGVGTFTLNALTTGVGNTGFGGSFTNGGSLASVTTGSYNTGALCGYNFTGTNYNTCAGLNALRNAVGTAGNTAFGIGVLSGVTTGGPNTGFGGAFTGSSISTGSDNVVASNWAMESGSSISGNGNTALGYQTLQNLSGNTSFDTAVGINALSGLTTGQNNTALGYQAGDAGTAVTGESNNTFIGYQTQINAAGYTNSTALGNSANITASNSVVLGNPSISKIFAQVTTITGISDRRRKKDITGLDDDLGLTFVDKLKPVSYRFNNGDETLRYGFIAQDLENALPSELQTIVETAKSEHGIALVERGNDKDRTYRVGYSELFAPIVKSIQQQEA